MPLKASIVGITGYTGLETLRILLAHPDVEIAHITGRDVNGIQLSVYYPHLSHLDLAIEDYDPKTLIDGSDVVFVALPHLTAQDIVAELHGKVKVIDLSADYRLDVGDYWEYYQHPHNHHDLIEKVIYGAPEIYRDDIKGAETVANPGCFALLAQLMLLPFAGSINHVDIMAITGSSGSGKSPGGGTHHPVRSHNMQSYNINVHRHIPEIIRTAKIDKEQLNFVPTSGPFVRGIFATAFVKTDATEPADIYGDHPYIRMAHQVTLANVVGSNYCDLSFTKTDGGYIVQGALDNLVKGAAGCAVQNMNLMFGLDETAGLSNLSPVYP